MGARGPSVMAVSRYNAEKDKSEGPKSHRRGTK